jgi:hypothetical protein
MNLNITLHKESFIFLSFPQRSSFYVSLQLVPPGIADGDLKQPGR